MSEQVDREMETMASGSERRPIRVLVADDHPILRAGLRVLLSRKSSLIVVGEAGDGREALEACRELKPDVAVLDIAMPGMDGVEACRAIGEEGLPTKVLILTMFDGEEHLVRSLAAGARGFLLKGAVDTDLEEAIRVVAGGNLFLDGRMAGLVFRRAETDGPLLTPPPLASGEDLSERERAVVQFTVLGFTSREIGERLHLSPKTVETYRARAMQKLGAERRSDLIRFALSEGIFPAAELTAATLRGDAQ
ncbi:MAG: response regulator transcription factor [Firmicutes bacterium]|nr:response regulator transcription factor [Bacillota bacterium]